MIGLKIEIDNIEPIIIGAGQLERLDLVLRCYRPFIRSGDRPAKGDNLPSEVIFDISVEGVTKRLKDGPEWTVHYLGDMPLGVGQIIKVTVIDIPLADAGLPTIPKIFATPHEVDRAKYFAYCKRTYLALREKYDSTNE